MPAAHADRMPATTSRGAPRRSRSQSRLARRLSYYAMRPVDIDHWLAQLDREWTADRALTANAGTLTLAGVALALALDRRWLALPAAVGALMVQHAAQGWSPPLPLLRWMGMRSAEEIAVERYALKALRGDFREVPLDAAWRPALERPGAPEPDSPAARALRDRAAAAMHAARR